MNETNRLSPQQLDTIRGRDNRPLLFLSLDAPCSMPGIEQLVKAFAVCQKDNHDLLGHIAGLEIDLAIWRGQAEHGDWMED